MRDALSALSADRTITEAQRRAGEALKADATPGMFAGLPKPALVAALVQSVARDGIVPPRFNTRLHGPWPDGPDLLRQGLDRLARS